MVHYVVIVSVQVFGSANMYLNKLFILLAISLTATVFASPTGLKRDATTNSQQAVSGNAGPKQSGLCVCGRGGTACGNACALAEEPTEHKTAYSESNEHETANTRTTKHEFSNFKTDFETANPEIVRTQTANPERAGPKLTIGPCDCARNPSCSTCATALSEDPTELETSNSGTTDIDYANPERAGPTQSICTKKGNVYECHGSATALAEKPTEHETSNSETVKTHSANLEMQGQTIGSCICDGKSSCGHCATALSEEPTEHETANSKSTEHETANSKNTEHETSISKTTENEFTNSRTDFGTANTETGKIIGTTDENTSITKNCIVKVNQTSCFDFDESTGQLKQRAQHINYWKCELERAIRDIDAEIHILEEQRQQLKNAMDTLKIPEYITAECLQIRTCRMQSDLIHDAPQEALFLESNLIEDIKRIHADLLRDIERQMDENVSAKENLERDWSNKYMAFKYESDNVELETTSTNVKDYSGSTKLSEGQSNVASWEQNTINILNQFKSAIDRSKLLRAKVETSLINSSRDLRNQDIKVNKALSERIAATQQVKTELENQLKLTLQKITETENVLETLHDEIMKVSQRIHVAQTRLTIKNCRPNIENCREGSLLSVIDEVRDLNDSKTLLQKRVVKTEELRSILIQERSKLENEIIVKKKSLFVDNERCLFLRSHYQSAEKMCGF